jgi:hypothetical protein
MLLNFETVAHDGVGGYVIPRKITHPSIAALLPGPGVQIGVGHGEALAAWCRAGGSPSAKAGPVAPPADPAKAAKGKLWSLAKKYVGSEDMAEIEAALKAKAIALKPLAQLTGDEIQEAITKLELELNQ